MPEGVYSLVFAHPRLDTLRFTPDPVRVATVPPQIAARDLAIPPLGRVLTASCPRPAEGSALLGGVVTSRAGGAPLAGVPLRAAWLAPGESGDTVRAVAVSDDAGMYRFCALPARVPVRVAAALPGAAEAEVRLEPGRAAVHDLAVDAALALPPRAAGRGRIVLRMIDAGTSRPIAGATVRVGALPQGTTDRQGMVTIAEVPAGNHGIEFRHDTYGVGTARAVVQGRADTELELRVPRRPVILEPLVVEAGRVLPGAFNEDSRGRRLDILTRTDIARLPARNLGELVTRIPGVRVKQGPQGSVCIESTRFLGQRPSPSACEAVQLVLDDMVVGTGSSFAASVPLEDVESVIFLKPTEGFAQYGIVGQKGVLLVYTRGHGPTAQRRP